MYIQNTVNIIDLCFRLDLVEDFRRNETFKRVFPIKVDQQETKQKRVNCGGVLLLSVKDMTMSTIV